jgi:hypothetical protein
MAASSSLFELDLPQGLQYREDFITLAAADIGCRPTARRRSSTCGIAGIHVCTKLVLETGRRRARDRFKDLRHVIAVRHAFTGPECILNLGRYITAGNRNSSPPPMKSGDSSSASTAACSGGRRNVLPSGWYSMYSAAYHRFQPRPQVARMQSGLPREVIDGHRAGTDHRFEDTQPVTDVT